MPAVLLVEGMKCKVCVQHVSDAARRILPDATAAVDLAGKTLTVDPAPADLAPLIEAIRHAGYEALVIDADGDHGC
jgi:copper chaperone CopZ